MYVTKYMTVFTSIIYHIYF